MKVRREDILNMIVQERLNQLDSTESDLHKTKNDWCGTAAYYLFEGSSKKDKHVSFDEFRRSLIKTSAVLLAALETSFALEDLSSTNILDKLNELEESKHERDDDCSN